MNKNMLIVIVVVVLAGAGVFMLFNSSSEKPAAPTDTSMESDLPAVTEKATVKIENYSFNPKTLTIKAGTVVNFTNSDAVAHTATADNGTFDTGLLDEGALGAVTFTARGTYEYHCTPHPNMRGTIIVE